LSAAPQTTRRYTALNRAIHAFASTGLGAWLFARVLRPVDRLVYRISAERTTLTALLAGLPIVVIDTIGAKTGRLRRIPLVALTDPSVPGAIVVIGSNFGQRHHPAWMANLRANPVVRARVNGQTRRFCADELNGDAYERAWAQAVAAYPGYARYKVTAGARRIAIMRLAPLPDA
jgi:deazaflavin-dependent oxidoreductase (nitroreductase family)